MSHQTFYEHFANKHDAFVAAMATGQAQVVAAATNAFSTAQPWPEAVDSALRAWTAYLAAEPALTKFCFNDILTGGTDAGEHVDAAQRGFAGLLAPGAEEHATPPVVTQATVGAVWTLVEGWVADNATRRLPDHCPELVFLTLAPYLGAPAARAAAWPS